MKWALAFATARVLAEKIEFLEAPYFYSKLNLLDYTTIMIDLMIF